MTADSVKKLYPDDHPVYKIWSHPTPYETAMSQIDEAIKTFEAKTPKERYQLEFLYGGNKRKMCLHNLQVKAACKKLTT